MPSNIYEALLLQLAPLICDARLYGSIDTSSSFDYYDYEYNKKDLENKLDELRCNIVYLNECLVDYFKSVYDRIKMAPMGLSIDVAYGVPMHKVFECLVAAEVGGRVVGGKCDQGIDVIGPYENVIFQCKSGTSHSSNANARTIYEKLIKTCTDTNKSRAVLAVTDARFPSINKYPDLKIIAEQNELNIEHKLWEDYDITHPIHSKNFNKIFEEFQSNLQVLSRFLTQIQESIGQKRRIHWDDILKKCIQSVQSIPDSFNDAQSSIYDDLNSLQTAYEDDDSMKPWEKAFMEGSNRSNSDSENTDKSSDADSEDSESGSDDNPEDIK
jgi:hypothetical protein